MKAKTTQLRKQLHGYLDKIDADFLRVLNAMIEEHLKVKQQDITLSASDIKEIEKRKAALVNGIDKGIEAGALSRQIRQQLKKRRK